MKFVSTLAVLAVAALATGCQSTSVRSAWFDTDFKGPPMSKIVVAGSVNSVAEDRLVEEVFVERMRATGVDAVAGHTLRLDDPNLSQADFEAAVKGTGAQGLLLVRVLGVDTRTQVSTTMVHGGMGWGHNSWGPTNTWGGMHSRGSFPVQEIRQYDLATVETKLFDVNTRRLVWAVTTTTFNPRSVAQEAPPFANLIIEQLKGRQIIAVK
ncbi:DUF4136 domain-containing protein [Roseateles albus]|uniref:DUF4136 domain-containing protein n=1 Tax=Roseateles albus TaxID=2987525 RepID=A0ABT5KK15_9BURK|nr:hypothetical protein [Roseateles albus]MDC8774281.1 hypothetical protein [Roseateles albus]